MYIAVGKIEIDMVNSPSVKRNALATLAQRIRTEFKASAKIKVDKNGGEAIYVAVLGENQQRLEQKVEMIISFSENFGIGRCFSDSFLIDDIDAILQDSQE